MSIARAPLAYPMAVGHVTTRVLEAPGAGRSVLFLHGLGARADRWRNNLLPLADSGYRAIAVDFPGHGFASKGVGPDYSVDGYATFIAALIEKMGLRDPVLVGTSLGGHVAAMLACRLHPALAGLMLVGATGLFPVGVEVRERLASRAMDRSHEGIAAKARVVFADLRWASDDFLREEYFCNNSPGADEAFASLAAYFRKSLDDDAVGEKLAASASRPPIELVWGERDKSVSVEIGKAAALLLSAPLHVVPGSAHAPYYENPEAFNQLLFEFLRSIETGNA